jgi:hypothetical protein
VIEEIEEIEAIEAIEEEERKPTSLKKAIGLVQILNAKIKTSPKEQSVTFVAPLSPRTQYQNTKTRQNQFSKTAIGNVVNVTTLTSLGDINVIFVKNIKKARVDIAQEADLIEGIGHQAARIGREVLGAPEAGLGREIGKGRGVGLKGSQVEGLRGGGNQ